MKVSELIMIASEHLKLHGDSEVDLEDRSECDFEIDYENPTSITYDTKQNSYLTINIARIA